MIDSFTGPYRFLSNFYEHPFSFRGAVYRTAEHAYQAAKTDNLEEWFMVKSAATPSQAKRMGRTVIEQKYDINHLYDVSLDKLSRSLGR